MQNSLVKILSFLRSKISKNKHEKTASLFGAVFLLLFLLSIAITSILTNKILNQFLFFLLRKIKLTIHALQ